jgi:signal transduction histidine kinase
VVVVSVRDTGSGIPEDQIGRMFEGFATGDYSLARKHGGAGELGQYSKQFLCVLQLWNSS